MAWRADPVGVFDVAHMLAWMTFLKWKRERDSNPRPSRYEHDELPGCSTPQDVTIGRESVVFKNFDLLALDQSNDLGDPSGIINI